MAPPGRNPPSGSVTPIPALPARLLSCATHQHTLEVTPRTSPPQPPATLAEAPSARSACGSAPARRSAPTRGPPAWRWPATWSAGARASARWGGLRAASAREARVLAPISRERPVHRSMRVCPVAFSQCWATDAITVGRIARGGVVQLTTPLASSRPRPFRRPETRAPRRPPGERRDTQIRIRRIVLYRTCWNSSKSGPERLLPRILKQGFVEEVPLSTGQPVWLPTSSRFQASRHCVGDQVGCGCNYGMPRSSRAAPRRGRFGPSRSRVSVGRRRRLSTLPPACFGQLAIVVPARRAATNKLRRLVNAANASGRTGSQKPTLRKRRFGRSSDDSACLPRSLSRHSLLARPCSPPCVAIGSRRRSPARRRSPLWPTPQWIQRRRARAPSAAASVEPTQRMAGSEVRKGIPVELHRRSSLGVGR